MRISDWSADVCSSDLKVIAPLTNPAAYGGNPRDAFHVIAPSIPGYGFSDAPTGTGWGVERIAQTWIALIRRLGYDRFVAQGGDWGAAITTAVAMARPPECAAIHLNMPLVFPEADDFADPIGRASCRERVCQYV